jgi:hypothetical protein
MQQPKKVNKEIEPFIMNLHVINVNGAPAVQFRKIITNCDKNINFFNELVKAALDDKAITAPVQIQFNDKLKAIQKLKELGYIFEKKGTL